MINKWTLAFGGISIIALSFYYISIMKSFSIKANDLVIKPKLQLKKLSLDTPGCQIPYLDPMHPSVAYMIERLDPLVCKTKLPPPVVPGENLTHPAVKLLSNNLRSYGANTRCFYKSLYRLTDLKSGEDNKKHPIDKEYVNVTDEFIKVECVASKDTVFTDYFAFVQRKADVEKRCQKAKAKSLERLNVLLLGIDSMSRNQFLRHMKRTNEYIAQNTHNVDFLGYNKIGRNTYANMVALMTGHLESELPDTAKVVPDGLPWIWKEFAKSGYRTLLNEDLPNTFTYDRKGFDAVPTDYYLKPFNVVTESSDMLKRSTRGCFNSRLETDVILKYTGDFFDEFKDEPVFAFTFIARLSHDYINEPSLQDEPFMRFMKRMKQEGHLERSIVFFFGDHGFRFGSIRSTYVGRIEGKLPFLFILVPSWFPDKYPKLYANLQTNSQRLTTVLDMYATLRDILHFTGQVSTTTNTEGRNVSLLSTVISSKRTCEDANIAKQYCTCTKEQQVSQESELVQKAAQHLVNMINSITENERKNCNKFTLDSVKSATVQMVGLGELHAESTSPNYRVTFRVSPGGGIFEGSVWYLDDKFHPEKEIERVNRYGNQSICINTAALKPYCYCNIT